MSSRAAKLHALSVAHLRITQNPTPIEVREKTIEILNALIVEGIDVALSAKHAHWNARGASFMTMHELFERVGKDLDAHIDILAERAAALDGIVHGTVQQVASETTLKPYPMYSIADHEHVGAMASRLGLFAAELRIAIGECHRIGDPVTVDLVTQMCAAVDKVLWLVESHKVHGH
jgi:starvation-inducible DNA-binding protein